MKTPEEIKKGLECCIYSEFECTNECPYAAESPNCSKKLLKDTFAQLDKVTKWISVDDRLPDEHQRVLIFVQRYGEPSIHTTGFSGGAWHITLLDCEHVTHWMPLPQSPEPVRDTDELTKEGI